MKYMHYALLISSTLCIMATACKSVNKTQKGAALGTAGGTAIGAIIGKASGNKALGAIIGATAGG